LSNGGRRDRHIGRLQCVDHAPDCASSALNLRQDRKIEPAKALWRGHDLDLGDLPACDREAQGEHEPAARGHDHAHGPIHERRSGELRTPPEQSGHGSRTAELLRRTPKLGGKVWSEHDVRVEQCDQGVEVRCVGLMTQGIDRARTLR
jgi:hypothetical protein